MCVYVLLGGGGQVPVPAALPPDRERHLDHHTARQAHRPTLQGEPDTFEQKEFTYLPGITLSALTQDELPQLLLLTPFNPTLSIPSSHSFVSVSLSQ